MCDDKLAPAMSAEGARPAGDEPNAALKAIGAAHRHPVDVTSDLVESLLSPCNLGRPSDARGMGLTIADLDAYAKARGIRPSADFQSAVAQEAAFSAASERARKRAPGAGRPPMPKTQYDVWAERRRDLHRRVHVLPRARNLLPDEVLSRVCRTLLDRGEQVNVRTVGNQLTREKFHQPHPTNLRKQLKRLGLLRRN